LSSLFVILQTESMLYHQERLPFAIMTNMESNYDNIIAFWQWFVKNEANIKDCIENEHSTHTDHVVDQLNEHILGLGVLTWDLGLDKENNWFFMLSPNGNPEMFEVSQAIIDEAPDHIDWLFYDSKPAKEWDRQFSIYDSNMDEKFINASEWNYVVLEDDDGMLELIIEAKNMPLFNEDDAQQAAEQFIIQEIGEAMRIEYVSSIEIVNTLDEEFEESKNLISELKEHVEEIISGQ
jgi:hypothetical protein